MAPDAHPVVAIDLPRRVVDLAAAPAELDVEAGRRPRVEREHAIVRVHAERVRDLDTALETPVVRYPDVVHGTDLEHEVMQPLRHGRGGERHGVMSRIRMEDRKSVV